jgi:hypothetical protein
MSLQELKEKASQLSVSDRLALLSAIVQSLQSTPEQELLKLEADEERYRLETKGVQFEPTNAA